MTMIHANKPSQQFAIFFRWQDQRDEQK
jgi:hypothetical protein